MAQVTGLTKERMLAIEGGSVVSGLVDANGDLILTHHDGTEDNAGHVVGPPHEIYIPMKAATDLPSTYPIGITTMTYGSGAAQGFPAALGTVFTYMESVARGFQIVTDKDKKTVWMRVVGQDSWGAFFQLAIVDGDTLTVPKVRVTATGDAYEAGTGHAFQIGPDNGENVIIDGNEIMARNNGVSKRLYIQNGISQDADAYPPANPGDVVTKKYVDALRSGSTILSGAGIDLNTRTTPGVYTIAATADVVAGSNFPTGQAGLLEVFSSGGHTWQRYTPYGNYANKFYQRAYYGFGAYWSSWAAFFGGPDVGWTNLTPGSGFASSPTGAQKTASACLINGVVHFRGVLTGSFTVNTTHTVATIPASLRPLQNPSNFKVIGSTGGFLAWANATDAGVLSVHFKSPFATGTATIELSGMSYPLD